MTAAAQRASLAAIGRDLALAGGDRRAAELLRSLQGDAGCETSSDLGDLALVPDWLRVPRNTQRDVARGAALLAMAPRLANSIDGAWLGAIAEMCGEDVLDWAIASAETAEGVEMPQLAPEVIDGAGFALMRAALRPSLRAVLDWAPAGDALVGGGDAERLVAAAWERCRS